MRSPLHARLALPVLLLFGEPSPLAGDLMLGAGWVINLAVVQWALGRQVPTQARMISARA